MSHEKSLLNRPIPSTIITRPFLLSTLAQQNLLSRANGLTTFQQQTGLADFFWQTTYYNAEPTLPKSLADLCKTAEGFVIFLHGWDGNHRIWEDMPLRLVERNPQLVCFNADVNGFGQTPFINRNPKLEQASLPSAMVAVEQWLKLIGVWSNHTRATQPYFIFVGHSMGAGMIFYLDELAWQQTTYGCYIMAPGMFYGNLPRKILYKIVATATRDLPYITPLKNLAARLVIFIAMNKASRIAKFEHANTFYQTTFKTLGDTLDGIGASPKPMRKDWSNYRIALGHHDLLVRLSPTIRMLQRLGLNADQIRILIGDHYFFSYDNQSPISHKYNRQIIIDELIEFAQKLKKQV